MAGTDDPTDVRSVAVTAEDVVTAYQATCQSGRDAVLRVTPPFSGRMRARLHERRIVPGDEAAADADPSGEGPGPLEIQPAALLEDPPAVPNPDDTEDEIRADPDDEYTPERHRERHEARVVAWRERVRDSIRDTVVLETPAGRHEVEVAVLGD